MSLIGSIGGAVASAAVGSALGGGKGKTKVKRHIPKPTKEEQELLQLLMQKAKSPYKTNPRLIELLENPYQVENSLTGKALMDTLLRGWSSSPGNIYMQSFAANPKLWDTIERPFNMLMAGKSRRVFPKPWDMPQEPENSQDIWDLVASYGE